MKRSCVLPLALLWLANGHLVGFEAEPYPELRVRQLTLGPHWKESPIVVTGEVHRVELMGVQDVNLSGPPIPQTIERIFWCRGTLRVDHVIKGNVARGDQEYIWGQAHPGCGDAFAVHPNLAPAKLRVWFVRDEGGTLRPTAEGLSRSHLSFRWGWDAVKVDPPARRFAVLLLEPEANARTLEGYAGAVWEHADVAASILPRDEAIALLSKLSRVQNAAISRDACDVLRTLFGKTCVERFK
jgi:hypothetical protein